MMSVSETSTLAVASFVGSITPSSAESKSRRTDCNIYTNNVPFEMGSRVDFAQLIKTYSASQVETRYSPATITGIEKIPRFGNPDMDKVSTSATRNGSTCRFACSAEDSRD